MQVDFPRYVAEWSLRRMALAVLGLLLISFIAPRTVAAGSFFDQFIDPKDGYFDTSIYLLEKRGLLPVPIIITEPTVGYGGGAALLWFHETKGMTGEDVDKGGYDEDEDLSHLLPPSVSGVAAAGTSNGSWIAAGFHSGIWKEDRIRYLGALGYASLNLEVYGVGEEELDDAPANYQIEGGLLLQEIKFRVKETNFFVGGRYSYLGSSVRFDDEEDEEEVENLPGLTTDQLDVKVGGAGLLLTYDARNNFFSPTRGLKVDLEAMYHDKFLGSDEKFHKLKAASFLFWGLTPKIDMGWKVDTRFSGGDVPFFELPFINLRGIRMLRYQDEVAVMTELEAAYKFNPRWSVLGFGGVGRVAGSLSDVAGNDNRFAGGGGFRYLFARRLGLKVGIDVARGPEDTIFYIQVGSAWNF